MKEPKVSKGEPAQTPICNLNIRLPDEMPAKGRQVSDTVTLEKKYPYLEELGTGTQLFLCVESRMSCSILNQLRKVLTVEVK